MLYLATAPLNYTMKRSLSFFLACVLLFSLFTAPSVLAADSINIEFTADGVSSATKIGNISLAFGSDTAETLYIITLKTGTAFSVTNKTGAALRNAVISLDGTKKSWNKDTAYSQTDDRLQVTSTDATTLKEHGLKETDFTQGCNNYYCFFVKTKAFAVLIQIGGQTYETDKSKLLQHECYC